MNGKAVSDKLNTNDLMGDAVPLDPALIAGLSPDLLVPDRLASTVAELSEPQQRFEEGEVSRWQWTQYLLRSSFSRRVIRNARRIPGAWYAGVGLVPWAGTEVQFDVPTRLIEAAKESLYVWGGLILTSEQQGTRLLGDRRLLHFETASFPIVVRHARHWPQTLSASQTGVLLGTVAAWAKTTSEHSSGQGIEGCITAEHVVGAGATAYDIEDGGVSEGSATVVNYAPPSLDAAFLSINWSKTRTSFAPLKPSSIASGDPSEFEGAKSGKVSGFVTHISAHARYTGSGVPMVLCYSGLGVGGDSGAKVDVNGTPAAMHLSQIDLDSGGQESRSILLQQLSHVMKLQFFH